jgi:D-alanine-D-alanine ligase
MKIALLHNPRPSQRADDVPDDTYEEYESQSTIAAIAASLGRLDLQVEPVVADARLPWRLADGRFDFAFNIAEGTGRRCREAVPVAVCELLSVPFTGSDALTLAITLDKFIAKRVVSPDVPVARGVLVESTGDDPQLTGLAYPVLVKPNDEGSSKGIRENPVCADAAAARERVRWLQTRYACPVLVEEFLTGAEVTVAVAGNAPDVRILGMMEIAPVAGRETFVYSLEVKRDWTRHVRYHVPPRLDVGTLAALRAHALSAYRLLGCRDLARIDFRLDAGGVPHFMECNPLPGLDPVTSDVVMISKDHLPYDALIQGVLLDAMRRTGVSAE